ncbi:STAS domain-containing protein [Pantoea sp. 18069]|uniref:STAS domain-containing protein n=1 Tax=Pantoea sp. 18069 TaxID=2681415 RepID=UPI001357B4C1|nr:STAS domain-containing protein [Pantoea sp. 18069]
MSTDDSKRGGLFSKVVRFVRHPTVSWSQLDVQADDPLGQADKQVLRQALERKRRNDFVRQREFDQLRKLRQQEVQSAGVAESLSESASSPTSFQSSLIPPDARAVTRQKIDAIEEQMSQQWWRNKQPADASTLPMYLLSTFPQADSVHVAAAPGVPDGEAAHGGADSPPGFALTAPLDWHVEAGDALEPAPPLSAAQAGEPERAAVTTTFAVTEPHDPPDWGAQARPLPSIGGPAPVFVHDPDFEQAAIAFANGNAAGAEALLLALLAQREAQPDMQQPVWQALFDLYRAVGMAERFDVLAIDFAARFGRSAPLWFALSAQRGWVEPGAAADAAGPGARAWRWNAPAQLTRQSVAALQRAKAAAPAPWTLIWTALEHIDADALAPFEVLVNEWAQTPGQIIFLDAPVLAQRLQALTVSGDREAPEDGWRLRMAALRLMAQHDSFELVALDYCVTYEVSPPSWTPPRSSYLDALEEMPEATETMAQAPAGGGLVGCIEGDAMPWLVPLEAQARRDLPLVVDCSELIRLDFAAAGSVLNWSARMQAQGVELRFERMHQLVAVFFGMIGVSDHARLLPRTD